MTYNCYSTQFDKYNRQLKEANRNNQDLRAYMVRQSLLRLNEEYRLQLRLEAHNQGPKPS